MTAFYIGASRWSGISKLVEEAGEVIQVCGKLIANGGQAEHWDGTNLHRRLEEELGDLLAAIEFVGMFCSEHLSSDRIAARKQKKLYLFVEWHTKQRSREEGH